MSNTESYWQDRVKHLESAIELACQTRNAAVDATIIVCKERDRLLARLEEKTKEHGSDSMELSIIIEKRDAELASALTRAEAAEALLEEAEPPHCGFLSRRSSEWRAQRDAHLAKHGGGE